MRGYWVDQRPGGALKRAFDFTVAATALVALAPLFFAVAVAIKQDGGPVLFRHARIGHGGRAFSCLKFRTMAVDASNRLRAHLAANPVAAREWRERRKLADDPRVTRVGRFLRKTSLDELPQLVNVLLGQMSLVGPRPVTRGEIGQYGLDRVYYLSARPGVTGLWQVSGRSDLSYGVRVLFDRRYVREWSFVGDLKILAETLPAVMSARGAY
ncbi:MAG: sugar transferase [Alphaproteobacteria bacterium]